MPNYHPAGEMIFISLVISFLGRLPSFSGQISIPVNWADIIYWCISSIHAFRSTHYGHSCIPINSLVVFKHSHQCIQVIHPFIYANKITFGSPLLRKLRWHQLKLLKECNMWKEIRITSWCEKKHMTW